MLNIRQTQALLGEAFSELRQKRAVTVMIDRGGLEAERSTVRFGSSREAQKSGPTAEVIESSFPK